MSAVAAAAQEPPEEGLGRVTGDLRALHSGQWVATPFASPATRRLIMRRRIEQRIQAAREAAHEAGRRQLDEALTRIVGAAPLTLSARVRPSGTSLWDPTFEVDPYWSPTAILGFRAWQVRGRMQGARRVWTGPTYEAGCVSRGKERFDDSVPHTDGSCGRPPCGIYATKDPDMLLREFWGPRMAFGLVELAGKVVEHDHGYRAKRATAVFVALEFGGRLITVEGPDEIAGLFTQPETYLDMRPRPPGPLRSNPLHAVGGALRDAAARRHHR